MQLEVDYTNSEEQALWENIIHQSLNSLNDVTGIMGGNLPPLNEMTEDNRKAFSQLTLTIVTKLLESWNLWMLQEYEKTPSNIIQMINKSYMSMLSHQKGENEKVNGSLNGEIKAVTAEVV